MSDQPAKLVSGTFLCLHGRRRLMAYQRTAQLVSKKQPVLNQGHIRNEGPLNTVLKVTQPFARRSRVKISANQSMLPSVLFLNLAKAIHRAFDYVNLSNL